jgi:hypothetical protein
MSTNKWVTREYGPMTRAQHRYEAAGGPDPVKECRDAIALLRSRGAPPKALDELLRWMASVSGGGAPPPAAGESGSDEREMRRARLGLSTPSRGGRVGNLHVLGPATVERVRARRAVERGGR